ncbi:MAG: hypothetical protein ACYDAG_08470 [Chloroflexota bacterium]
MLYELWDSVGGNAIAGFPTEAEALAVVRAEIAASGSRSAVASWFLASADSQGQSELIAEGTQLVDRAFSAPPSRAIA